MQCIMFPGMKTPQTFDCIVAGAGPAGLAAACLLARAGCKTALVAPGADSPAEPPNTVRRTVALMQPAIRLLETLEIWPQDLQGVSASLDNLKLVDDTGSTFAAPTVNFASSELGEEPFGWNIPLEQLTNALHRAALSAGATPIAHKVVRFTSRGGAAQVETDGGVTVHAPITVAADGRNSPVRACAGVSARTWEYPQVALAMSFAHTRAHNGTSIELHKSNGPFTTVPLPGNKSSLVWLVNPDSVDEITSLSPDHLAIRLQLEMHGELGLIESASTPVQIPMMGLTASKFAASRAMLIGEAAHVVPPIGAQGLNMSLRDAAHAAELVCDANRLDEDPGSDAVLAKFDTARRADVVPRQAAIDTMNRSLISQFFPLHAARSAGMNLLQHVPPLRKMAMEHGLQPPGPLPRTMR